MGWAEDYLAANPDVAAATAGWNPEEAAAWHWQNYGQAEGRQQWSPTPVATPTPTPTPATTPTAQPTTGLLAAPNQTLTQEQLNQLIANRYQGFEGQWGINPQAQVIEDMNGNIHRINATAALPTGNGQIGLFEIQPQADGTYKLVSGGIQGTPAQVEQQIRTIDAEQNAAMNRNMGLAAAAVAGLGAYQAGLFGGTPIGGGTGAAGAAAPIAEGSMFTTADLAAATQSFNPVSALAAQGLTAAEIAALGYSATEAAAAVAAQAAITSGVVDAGISTIYPAVVPPGSPPPGMLTPPPVVAPPGSPTPPPGTTPAVPPPGVPNPITNLLPDWAKNIPSWVLAGGANAIAAWLQNNQNQKTQDGNNALTQKAMENAQFKPYGSRFAQVNPTYKDGVFQGFNTTRDPMLAQQQNRMLAMAPGLVDQYYYGIEKSHPLGYAGYDAMNLGRQYLQKSPEAQAADWMSKQQGLLQPERERALAEIRNRAQQTGRSGLATMGTSTTMATNPELAAYYNAVQQENNRLASQATAEGRAQAQFGAGLVGTGGDLYKSMYGMQTAAYQPLQTMLGGVQNLEGMFQIPEDRSMLAAGKNVPSANLLAQQQQAPQTSPFTALLNQGVNAYQQYQARQPVTTQNPYVPAPTPEVARGGDYNWPVQETPFDPNGYTYFGL